VSQVEGDARIKKTRNKKKRSCPPLPTLPKRKINQILHHENKTPKQETSGQKIPEVFVTPSMPVLCRQILVPDPL